MADWGNRDGYFASNKDAETFYDELTWLCLNQYGSFNSPVWFNCGLYSQYGVGKRSGAGNYYFDAATRSVNRAAIAIRISAMLGLFHPVRRRHDGRHHGTGAQRSDAVQVRQRHGHGPVVVAQRPREIVGRRTPERAVVTSCKVYDAIASVVKSGGKTRRAAKMNTLKVWHPDIKEFIEAKTNEEKKAWALIEQGYAANFNGDAYGSVCSRMKTSACA